MGNGGLDLHIVKARRRECCYTPESTAEHHVGAVRLLTLSVQRLPGLDEDPVQGEVDAADVGADVGDDGHGELERDVWLHGHHVEHHLARQTRHLAVLLGLHREDAGLARQDLGHQSQL